jgi:hypothetical protein
MAYQIILFLHVAGALGFFLFHGATASAMFGLKREGGASQAKLLIRTREIGSAGAFVSMMVMLIAGIVLGFMGRWWSDIWIWASIAIVLVIGTLMGGSGRNYFDRVSYALDPEKYKAPKDKKDDPEPPTEKDLAVELAKGRPVMLTVTGVAALALFLWLMMFKPF